MYILDVSTHQIRMSRGIDIYVYMEGLDEELRVEALGSKF